VASDALLTILDTLSALPLPQTLDTLKESSRLAQLECWTSVESSTVMWLRASSSAVTLATTRGEIGSQPCVKRWDDISGNNNHAIASSVDSMPSFVSLQHPAPPRLGHRPAHPCLCVRRQNRDALGPGLGVIEFTGSCKLSTLPFTSALPQPLTLMLVGRAHGDVTFCDALTPQSDRFEYAGSPSHATCLTTAEVLTSWAVPVAGCATAIHMPAQTSVRRRFA
jgi:hypothetical protein